MHALLKTIVEDHSNAVPYGLDKGNDPVINPEISYDLKRKLLYKHIQSFDWQQGGQISPVKFVDRDSVEYSMLQASRHDQTESRMARLTLSNSFALLDQVWGGVYQYSTLGCWDQPHYEKTMANQATYLCLYTMAYSLWHEQRFLLAANSIYDYLKRFMTSPDGAFYAAQTDKISGLDIPAYFAQNNQQKLEAGIPAINKKICARENGWAIEALATLFEYTGEKSALHRAIRAAKWIINHRTLPEGGFRHDDYDADGPYLGDSLAMGRAFLQLHRVTCEQKWLSHACHALDFINKNFKRRHGGFNRTIDRGEVSRPAPQIDENISLTRFANLLFHYTGKSKYNETSKHGLRYLSLPQIANARQEEAGILLIDSELNESPVHIVIIGDKNEKKTKALYATALSSFGWYKKVNLYEKNEKKRIYPDLELVSSHMPVVYVINEYHCSKPVFEPGSLRNLLQLM